MNAEDQNRLEEIETTLADCRELQEDDCDWLISKLREADKDRDSLRLIFVEACNAIGNGSVCSKDSSVEFLRDVPKEILLVTQSLRAEVERLKGIFEDAPHDYDGENDRCYACCPKCEYEKLYPKPHNP